MAAVRITGATWPACPTARLGPFQDGSGNLWVIALNASSQATAYQSSDGGATWGTSYANTGLTASGGALDCVFDSTNGVIYAVELNSTHVAFIYKFTISTTTWARVDSGTGPTVQPDVNTQYPTFLCRRSDGSFVVVYQGPTATVMSVNYRQMYYITCTSAGVWGTATLAYGQSASSQHVDTKCAVLGASDRVHMLDTTSLATNTPLSSLSLSSANVLDTAQSIGITTGIDPYYYTLYYDATLAKVVTRAGAGSSNVWRATSQASPTWFNDANLPGTDTPASCATAFIYDTTGGTFYTFYRDSSTTDVFVNSTTSTTWGTAATQDVATAPTGISLGRISSGIGVLFNDSGVFFDKYSLGPQSYVRSAADTVSVSDAATRLQGLVGRTAADTVAVSDSATWPVPYSRLITGTSGLVSYWRLGDASGAAVDQKGVQNGVYNGSVTRGATSLLASDQVDGATSFPASSGSYVSIAANAAYNSGVPAISVEAWIKPAALTASTSIVDSWGGGGPWFLELTSSNRVRWYVADGISTDLQLAAGSLVVGSTYHVVAVYDAAGTMALYINGVSVGSPSRTPNANMKAVSPLAIDIGSRTSTTDLFSGVIDEVAIYNRALSATEVSQHYLIGSTAAIQALTRTASDTVTASDAATRAAQAFVRTSADTVTASDAATRAAYARTRTAADSCAVSDGAAGARGLPRIASDSWSVSDAAAGIRGMARTATDSVTVSDAATRAADARTRTAVDSVTVADSASRAAYGRPRTASDSWADSDAATRDVYARTRTASDSFAVSDSAVRAAFGPVRNATDAWTVADSAGGVRGATRAATDAWTVSDTAARLLGAARTAADSWAISDNAIRLLGVPRTAADTCAVSDSAARVYGLNRTAADSWVVADVATRLQGTARTAADSLSISDLALAGGGARIGSEGWTVADVATRGPGGRVRAASDSWAVSDLVTRIQGAVRSASDAWTVSDAVGGPLNVTAPAASATAAGRAPTTSASVTVPAANAPAAAVAPVETEGEVTPAAQATAAGATPTTSVSTSPPAAAGTAAAAPPTILILGPPVNLSAPAAQATASASPGSLSADHSAGTAQASSTAPPPSQTLSSALTAALSTGTAWPPTYERLLVLNPPAALALAAALAATSTHDTSVAPGTATADVHLSPEIAVKLAAAIALARAWPPTIEGETIQVPGPPIPAGVLVLAAVGALALPEVGGEIAQPPAGALALATVGALALGTPGRLQQNGTGALARATVGTLALGTPGRLQQNGTGVLALPQTGVLAIPDH